MEFLPGTHLSWRRQSTGKTDVLRLILRHGARIAVVGPLGGTGVALLATRALSSMLYGVDAHDPAVFLAVAASLLLVVLVASWVPARNASRVDPLVALRYE